MLAFEIRSLSLDNLDDDVLSEIVIGTTTNKYAYLSACSLARYYARECNCKAAVIAHDENDYLDTSFACFYASPYGINIHANAHKDINGFYTPNWRKGC